MEWRRWYVSLGRWFGVPVLAHATILLSLPYYIWRNHSWRIGLLVFCAYAVLLLAHELGHAAVSRWRRVKVYGIDMLLFHGRCRHAQPYLERDAVLIAWGGVGAQLVVLALTWMVIWGLRLAPIQTQWWVIPAASYFAGINLFTMAFNLLPIEPLDGVKAWRAVPLLYQWVRGRRRKASPGLNGPRFRTRQELEAESRDIAASVVTDMKAYAERRRKRGKVWRWFERGR